MISEYYGFIGETYILNANEEAKEGDPREFLAGTNS